jgi:hypothetical protein
MLAALKRFLPGESTASARTVLEGILVTVEGTGATSTTDADGRFSVQGSFEGSVSLLFQRADDGLSARIAVDVPAGGTLTLNDVTLDRRSGQATAMSQGVNFDGVTTGIDCPRETMTLVSSQRSPTATDTYTVRLNTSTLVDSRGNPIGCQDLQLGGHVHVVGSVNDDGTFGEAVVQEQG